MESLLDGFDKKKYIVDFFEDESFIKDLMDILSSFALQVAKKICSLYIPTKYVVFPFFKIHIVFFFFANMF
jgi:hypothetical protein